MAWEDVLSPRAATQYAAAVLMLALALGLVVVDRRARVNRAFAFFLVARGAGVLAGAIEAVVPEFGSVTTVVSRLAFLGILASLAYFVSIWPRARRPFGTTRYGPWIIALAAIAATLVFAYSQCFVLCELPDGRLFVGPLAAVPLPLALGGASALFLWRVDREPVGARREAIMLVGSVFALTSIFDGLRTLGVLTIAARADEGFVSAATVGVVPNLTFWAFYVGPIVGALLGALALARVFAQRQREGASTARLAAAAALAVMSGLYVGYVTGAALEGIGLVIVGCWRVAMPLVVAYAIFRHQLFDLDIKVKVTIQRSTIMGAFLAVFFVVEQLIQSYSNQFLGAAGGALAAGLLLFALNPVQRFAERFAGFAGPAHRSGDPEEGYRAALEMALADGVLTRTEERHLSVIATRLGIAAERAFSLREEAEAALGGAPT